MCIVDVGGRRVEGPGKEDRWGGRWRVGGGGGKGFVDDQGVR
jgi:hypothetical protein